MNDSENNFLNHDEDAGQSLQDLGHEMPIRENDNEIEQAYEDMELRLDNEINEILNKSNEIDDPEYDDIDSQDSTYLEQQATNPPANVASNNDTHGCNVRRTARVMQVKE